MIILIICSLYDSWIEIMTESCLDDYKWLIYVVIILYHYQKIQLVFVIEVLKDKNLIFKHKFKIILMNKEQMQLLLLIEIQILFIFNFY